jgi:hypothetical protein
VARGKGGGVTDSPSYLRRNRKDALMRDCLDTLTRDGWRCYTRGFPAVVAEKGCFMRLIVLRPKVRIDRGLWLGKGRDALSRAFYKCFGVKFEVWDMPEGEKLEEDWV